MSQPRPTAVPLPVPPLPALVAAGAIAAGVTAVCFARTSVGGYVCDASALVTSLAAAGMALSSSVFGDPPGAPGWRSGVRRLSLAGFAATLLTLVFDVANIGGNGLASLGDSTARAAVLGGSAYQAALVRCVGLAALTIAMTRARPRRAVLVAAAVVTSASWVLTGHARSHGVVAAICGVAHVVAVGAWLGGLLGLAVWMRSGTSDVIARGRLLASFAGLMTGVITMLLAGGVGLAVLVVPSPHAVLSTAYGQVLVLKVGVVAALLVVSASNHRRLVPLARQGHDAALAVLRMNIAVEQIGLVTVLLMTTVLAGQNPVP